MAGGGVVLIGTSGGTLYLEYSQDGETLNPYFFVECGSGGLNGVPGGGLSLIHI